MTSMDVKERKCLLSARMRNLKRKYAKITEHADLTDEALELKKEIDAVEHEINLL